MGRRRITLDFTVIGLLDRSHRGAVRFLPPVPPDIPRPTLQPWPEATNETVPWSVAAHLIAMAKSIVPSYDLMDDYEIGQLTADEAELYCWLQHWATRQRKPRHIAKPFDIYGDDSEKWLTEARAQIQRRRRARQRRRRHRAA